MAATYSGNPASSPKDQVRFLLRDTTTNGQDQTVVNPKFSDEEIEWLLIENGSVYAAAASGAETLAANYTDRADKTVGPLSVKYGEFANRYKELALSLRRRGGRGTGAVAITTQVTRAPHFRMGMSDHAVSALPETVDPNGN